MFDIDNVLTESLHFKVVLKFSWRKTELDIVPHWYNGDDYCNFYVFESGQELGTIISVDINEWEWVTKPDLHWLADLIGGEIDWHYT